MVDINTLIENGKLSKISDLELGRYVNFLSNSYKENFEHAKMAINDFPRWSIISGYYAMHDATKLLLAKNFRLKIDREVHATTIIVLKEVLKDKSILQMLKLGYKEFLSFANDLEEAKKERIKAQYYTGTAFMKREYKKRANEFVGKDVSNYLKKMEDLTQ